MVVALDLGFVKIHEDICVELPGAGLDALLGDCKLAAAVEFDAIWHWTKPCWPQHVIIKLLPRLPLMPQIGFPIRVSLASDNLQSALPFQHGKR